MPPSETRLTMHQASKLYGTVARKTLLGTTLGAVFCATEAYMENKRGTHDMWNGMAAGAAAGLAFGMARPMPQPIAWPLMFAGVAAAADIVGEKIPAALRNNRCGGRAAWRRRTRPSRAAPHAHPSKPRAVCPALPRRTYGPLENRENWGDPAPPRPPILETMHGARPMAPAHFWRGG